MLMTGTTGSTRDFRRILCHLRTRGVVVLRTPTQQGVQQEAKNRQWCCELSHEWIQSGEISASGVSTAPLQYSHDLRTKTMSLWQSRR